jgi:aquaporin Z
MEGFEIGAFMLAACTFATLLGHPSSPVVRLLPDPFARRLTMGLAMGLTAVGLIYSPWGQQSGAHFNPSVTLSYLRLHKIERSDAVAYIVAQFVGGVAGVGLAAILLGELVAHPAVEYAATRPGSAGIAVAFLAEVLISFVLMLVVLFASNDARLARHTGWIAGVLVATYITIESPLSGMSMNPARSFASALAGRHWSALWIYFSAPLIGMLAAAELRVRLRGAGSVLCAKLNHHGRRRCIFRCRFAELGDTR